MPTYIWSCLSHCAQTVSIGLAVGQISRSRPLKLALRLFVRHRKSYSILVAWQVLVHLAWWVRVVSRSSQGDV
jgi:hypothetical protein